MDIPGFKNTVSEIKNSLNWLQGRMGKVESRIHELKGWLIKISREKKDGKDRTEHKGHLGNCQEV